MISAETKAGRIMQLEHLLLAHPEGMRRSEIAHRLGVHPSTVTRYVDELGTPLLLTEDDDRRIGINRDGYLNHIRLTVHESLALYLGCRLMTDGTDRLNPHAASALRKLGESLMAFAPTIAEHIVAEADRIESPKRRHDHRYVSVLETLTRAWSEGRFVNLVHHSVHRGADDAYVFAVHLIVPYAVGRTVQVIGQCRGEDHPRTLRLDRILHATVADETYTVPAGAGVGKMLEDAWGIWSSDAEPVEILLRFSPQVAHRVRETQWHSSQELTDLADGRLLWRARIAEPREMLPWIRGWGADVEVLEPLELRESLREEIGRLAATYGGG